MTDDPTVELERQIAELKSLVAELKNRIAELEKQMGVSPTPWFWKNPLANKTFSANVFGAKVGITQEMARIVSDVTTTDTVNQTTVTSVQIYIPSTHVALYVFGMVQVKHSVAGARFTVMINIDPPAAPNDISIAYQDSLYLATAGEWYSFHLSSSWDIQANLVAGGVMTNQKSTLRLNVLPNTAGTLTVRGTGYPQSLLHAFVVGDSSR